MRYLKVLTVALVAMLAYGIVATSAFALPDISLLPGEKYPLHLNLEDNGKTVTRFVDTAGNELSGAGLKLLFLINELTSLGTFEALFLNVKRLPQKESCNTEGNKIGEELVKGTFRVTWLTLTPLTNGILFLFKELKIKCPALTVRIRGSFISSLKEPKAGEEVTELCGKLEGNGKGKNNLQEFENDKGEKVKAILEDNFGTGFLQLAVEVTGESTGNEVCAKALEKKMFEITGL
jgi:hypothetical protein